MSMMTLALLGVGLVLLVVGAELLVRGASRLAIAFGLSPLVVGLTVVAVGTSSPELAVSVQAALQGGGGADLAIGNVVGSNIFNVLFILGLTAMIAPLTVATQLVRLDVPILIGLSLLTFVLALDGTIGRLDGLLLCAGAITYTSFLVVKSRRESLASLQQSAHQPDQPDQPDQPKTARGGLVMNLLLIAGGLGTLVLGSSWLVRGAVEIARALGVSELIIGLTIIAAGTSLPEVATSVLAAIRGERDIAVGNAIGSCIFNLLLVLGLSSAIVPEGVRVATSVLDFDMVVMIAVAIACLPIFFTGYRIGRAEGALFFAYWLAYTGWLVLYAQQHDAIHTLGPALLLFVLPLTAVTLGVLAVREWRKAHRPQVSP